MGDKDTESKRYFSDPTRFADVFNFWVYDGEQIIKPKNLSELDATEIITAYGHTQQFPDFLISLKKL